MMVGEEDEDTNSTDIEENDNSTDIEENDNSTDIEENDNSTNIEEYVSQLILSISIDIKKEFLEALKYNLDQIWKVLNFLILLASIYITLFIFMCEIKEGIGLLILWPTILSGVFLATAISQAIVGIFPTPSPAIDPDKVYDLYFKSKQESSKDLIETYLTGSKRIILSVAEKSLIRKKVILLSFISVINFLLFVIYCLLEKYVFYVNFLSIILSLNFSVLYIYFVNKEKNKINKLRRDLNIEPT